MPEKPGECDTHAEKVGYLSKQWSLNLKYYGPISLKSCDSKLKGSHLFDIITNAWWCYQYAFLGSYVKKIWAFHPQIRKCIEIKENFKNIQKSIRLKRTKTNMKQIKQTWRIRLSK